LIIKLFIGELNQFNYHVIKNLGSGEVNVYDDHVGGDKELIFYTEPAQVLSEWVLKDEIKNINGHLCQRADISFGGRKWTAWFSLELSTYSDDPYKFGGLPGLIFQVHDAKKTWDFMLKDFSKIDTLISINFRNDLNFVKTTKEKLYKKKRDFQKSFIDIREASGHNFGIERRNLQANLEQYILKDNNWIELFQ